MGYTADGPRFRNSTGTHTLGYMVNHGVHLLVGKIGRCGMSLWWGRWRGHALVATKGSAGGCALGGKIVHWGRLEAFVS